MPVFPIQASRLVNGIRMMDIPGGVFAMGSAYTHKKYGESEPRMVRVSPFAASITHIREDEYCTTMLRNNKVIARADHPATHISFNEWKEFLQKRNEGKTESEQIGFLTEAELEFIARGPVVDVRKLMGAHGISTAVGLADYLRVNGNGYFLENFVSALDLGARIIVTPESPEFDELISGNNPVFAWRVWGTISGRLKTEEAVYARNNIESCSLTDRVNGYGISDVVGNVSSWGADIYNKRAYQFLPQNDPYHQEGSLGDIKNFVVRGGSWDCNSPELLRAANRNCNWHENRSYLIGLRVGARTQK